MTILTAQTFHFQSDIIPIHNLFPHEEIERKEHQGVYSNPDALYYCVPDYLYAAVFGLAYEQLLDCQGVALLMKMMISQSCLPRCSY